MRAISDSSIERPQAIASSRIVMDSPKRLNAADAVMHRELTQIWRDIDEDPDVSRRDHHAARARPFPAAATSIS